MIYLMRHGQDDETYVGGWSDVNRAIETAKIVSEILGVPYSLNSNLREQNKGKLNGVEKNIAYTKYPGFKEGEITVDTVFPDGESLRGLYERIKEYLDSILKMEDDTLLITHRGVINMIYFLLNNKDVDMNKKQFGVDVASVHELDKSSKTITKIK